MNSNINNIFKDVSNELDISLDEIKSAYISIWKFERTMLSEVDCNSKDNINKDNIIFLIPEIGKFMLNLKKMRKYSNTKIKKNNGKQDEINS